MRWKGSFPVAVLLSLSAVTQDLGADDQGHAYLADPFIEHRQMLQPPPLFWELAQPVDPATGKGRVRLDAGRAVSFALPALGHLRLQLDGKTPPPTLWLSGDGALWEEAFWTPGSDPHEWFHVQPAASPRLARLEAESTVRGRLLVGENDPVDTQERYQVLAPSEPLETVDLVDEQGSRLTVHRLETNRSHELDIQGPIVIALLSRPTEAREHQQAYSLAWALNGAPWQQFAIRRAQLSTHHQVVDGVAMHGGMDRRYLVIPTGQHRLRVKASVPLYLRIEEGREDYFLDFNEPAPGIGERTQTLLASPLKVGGMVLADLEALSQSNHVEGAADRALDYLAQSATEQSRERIRSGAFEQPLARALTGHIERSQRFFRTLLPGAGSTALRLHSAWFATSSALELEPGKDYYLGEGFLERLGRSQFVELGKAPVVYPLPRRHGPSELRLAVARLSPGVAANLHIQYDDAPPQRLKLIDPAQGRRPDLPEDARLAFTQGPDAQSMPATLSGHVAGQRPSGHYWSAATLTLPLPEDVQRIRVWSGSDDPVPVALQYRAAQPFYADESTYRALLKQLPPGTLVERLHRAMQTVADPAAQPLSRDPTAQRALDNQWYPVLRYLHAAQAAYLDDFSPEAPALAVEDVKRRVAKAQTEADRSEWVAALEALGSAGYGQDLQAYRLSQTALGALGEHYLAGRQRQAAAVFAADFQVRREVSAQLLTDYAATQSWEQQVSLLAARFLREGDGALLDPLAQALYRAGEPLWASQIGLLLAEERTSPDWLADAAQAAGWPETAGNASVLARQRGDLAMRDGATAQALALWRGAGEQGHARVSRLQEAKRIALQLASPDKTRRLAGIERWLAWSMSAQQTFDWLSVDDRIETSAGFSMLFSDVTRKPFAVPHTTPLVPAELEVVGPTVLRVRLRRLAPGVPQSGSIDWLQSELEDVQGRVAQLHAPILSRTTNPYLQMTHQNADVAAGDDVLLQVPAGLHRVRLRPVEDTYLIQIWQWHPEDIWPVLPPVTPLTLKDLLWGPAGRTGHRAAPAPELVRSESGQAIPPLPLMLQSLPSAPRYLQVRGGEIQSLPLSPARRLHTHDLVSLAPGAFDSLLGSVRFPPQGPVPSSWPVGSYAVALEGVVAQAGVPETPQAAYAVAVALLWQLEGNPALMPQVSARLARLADTHADVKALRQLADRLLEKQDWEYISSSFESVGVRQLPLNNQMHSPFRRVREALLPALPASRLLLSGRSIEGVEVFTPDPLTLDLRLEQQVLPHEKRLPIEVILRVNDRPPQRISLAEGEALERVHLEPGSHVLTLSLDEPRQQQFVTARVERSGSGMPLLEEEMRTYHIAAPDQPANFYIKGPAWVRVDEWTPDRSTTSYRYVESGWQILTLKGGVDQDRYYRLYALREVPDARLLEPRSIKAALAAPAEDSRQAQATAPAPVPLAWQVQDRHRPASGLDSWGAYLGFVERIDGSEDDILPSQGASVMEAGLSYRFRLHDSRLFGRSDLLMRWLDGNQEVLGARQWLDFYPAAGPWQLGLYAEAYLQPGEINGLEGDNHWAARLRGSIERTYQLSPQLRHKPGLSLNQRWLSLDAVPAQALSALDPDVFSPYKSDHRRSLVLADRLTWAPHWDQRAYVEGALVSNASLNPLDPDYLQVTTAVQQLFGPVAGEAGLRWRRYFADEDRQGRLDREQLFIGANLLRWDGGANALTLSAETLYDIDRRDFGWTLTIGFETNAGRMSPARRPDELEFLPLRRSQQAGRVETNSLDPIYP